MIKVHCLISCLCEIVKRRSSVDYRSYYFGIWDSDFDITDEGEITYFSDRIGHDAFLNTYEQFFGLKVHEWYDAARSREENLGVFLELLENKPEHRYLIVQIDMSLMPERENKFQQKPFPHYLMISKTEKEDEWFMFDPDFRWEGNVSRDRVIEAILGNEFGGGFYVDAETVQEPSFETIRDHFVTTFHPEDNELVSRLRRLVMDMAEGNHGWDLPLLTRAVKQLNILVIRKYSYDYALMFFDDTLKLPKQNYEDWCQEIRDLVSAFNHAQYLAVKLSMTGRRSILPQLFETIDKADEIEFRIKGELQRQFGLWCAAMEGRAAEPAGVGHV